MIEVNPYKDAIFDRRYSGTILSDGKDVAITRQCVHCNRHCLCVKGSGKRRGYCTRCNGFVCCEPGCPPGCIPFEQILEAMEGTLDLNNIPIVGRVEAEPPKG